MESPGPDFGESVWEEMAMKIGLFSEINGGYLFYGEVGFGNRVAGWKALDEADRMVVVSRIFVKMPRKKRR